jgi:hypothetical protein
VVPTNFNFLRSITESKFYVLIYLRSFQSKSLKPCYAFPLLNVKITLVNKVGITLSTSKTKLNCDIKLFNIT